MIHLLGLLAIEPPLLNWISLQTTYSKGAAQSSSTLDELHHWPKAKLGSALRSPSARLSSCRAACPECRSACS